MIPLKIIIGGFLQGKEIEENPRKIDLDTADRRRPIMMFIGCVMIACWTIGCCYAIIMFSVSFTDVALEKWLISFSGAFALDAIIMFNLKMLLKILIAILFMSIARFPIMLTVAGAIAGQIIDLLMGFVFPN